MQLTRRGFTGGALSAVLGSQLGAPALAQGRADLAPALSAIRAYGEKHLRYFGLPGMTLGMTIPDGFGTTLNFGFANADARTPMTDDRLVQIGSISKSMTAALIHQMAAEGRFTLADRVSSLLPGLTLPSGNTIQVQHLLDHVAGLAGDTPLFPPGGLATAYAPGAHWHYSNTAYAILGLLAEEVGAKPLGRLLEERLLVPLGMRRSRGAILGRDRLLYAQGYEAADQITPFVRGIPLAPTAWVDVTEGAGCVASTAEEMNCFLRSLADAVQGRGGLGLSPTAAKAFTSRAVTSDTAGMTYGNGLMHVGYAGRSYLHHTGGMPSFSSSFHIDVASGVGAFASSTITAFADYRPRLLTRFAVDALTNALAGKALPTPPRVDVILPNAAAFAGRYAGPGGAFEVRAGNPLTLVADGQSSELQYVGGNLFRTLHPAFRRFSLMFDRKGPAVTGAAWGPNAYLRQGSAGHLTPSDPALARLAGRFVNDNPWWTGMGTVVERGGKLWFGTETPLTRLGDNLWRVGDEAWSPERASFGDFIGGRPQTLIFSGERFVRRDI
ncbi:MAG TPA: serine hydrolase domain-containing protein [Sphingomicrobium sp.]|nr:serine hydrolase domain-containing protein [Sphingomicrobium sp.]